MTQSGASRLRVLWAGWRKSYVSGETLPEENIQSPPALSIFENIFKGERLKLEIFKKALGYSQIFGFLQNKVQSHGTISLIFSEPLKREMANSFTTKSPIKKSIRQNVPHETVSYDSIRIS